MRSIVPSVCFRTVEIDIKHQRKILFFGEGHSLFGLILAAPLVNLVYIWYIFRLDLAYSLQEGLATLVLISRFMERKSRKRDCSV